MKKKENKVRKFLGNRGLWGIVCFLLVMYYVIACGIGINSFKVFYVEYVNGWLFGPIVILAALVIYLARMEKDFFRGFRIAFSRKMSVSRMELQKALKAMEYAEKSVMLSTVLCVVFPLVDVFYHIDNTIAMGPVFAVMSLYLLYPAVFLLVLLPVKGRLEQMVVSYMEEPEDSGEERKEAEGQRLYFALRSLGLTDRETEVARLAASGMSNVEIGRELYISTATVKKHMTHILEKMQCADRESLSEKISKI